jgi:hypothetical protein
MKNLLIFICFHSFSIVKIVFALFILYLSLERILYHKPISNHLAYAFFWVFGIYIGFVLFRKAYIVINQSDHRM